MGEQTDGKGTRKRRGWRWSRHLFLAFALIADVALGWHIARGLEQHGEDMTAHLRFDPSPAQHAVHEVQKLRSKVVHELAAEADARNESAQDHLATVRTSILSTKRDQPHGHTPELPGIEAAAKDALHALEGVQSLLADGTTPREDLRNLRELEAKLQKLTLTLRRLAVEVESARLDY